MIRNNELRSMTIHPIKMENDAEKVFTNPNNSDRETEERKNLKSRLIDLKVDLVKIHAMPVYGRVILPLSNNSKCRKDYWRNPQFPFLKKFHEKNLKKYGG